MIRLPSESPGLVLAVVDVEWQLGELARDLRNRQKTVTTERRHATATTLTELADQLRASAPQVIDSHLPRETIHGKPTGQRDSAQHGECTVEHKENDPHSG